MSLDQILRSGIATLNRVTRDLQPTIQHQAWIGEDDKGKASYAAAVGLPAFVTRKQRMVKMKDGQLAVSRHQITFLAEIAPTGVNADRREPIDERDVITLPDGTTGPILSVDGFMDRGTGYAYLYEVMLG